MREEEELFIMIVTPLIGVAIGRGNGIAIWVGVAILGRRRRLFAFRAGRGGFVEIPGDENENGRNVTAKVDAGPKVHGATVGEADEAHGHVLEGAHAEKPVEEFNPLGTGLRHPVLRGHHQRHRQQSHVIPCKVQVDFTTQDQMYTRYRGKIHSLWTGSINQSIRGPTSLNK